MIPTLMSYKMQKGCCGVSNTVASCQLLKEHCKVMLFWLLYETSRKQRHTTTPCNETGSEQKQRFLIWSLRLGTRYSIHTCWCSGWAAAISGGGDMIWLEWPQREHTYVLTCWVILRSGMLPVQRWFKQSRMWSDILPQALCRSLCPKNPKSGSFWFHKRYKKGPCSLQVTNKDLRCSILYVWGSNKSKSGKKKCWPGTLFFDCRGVKSTTDCVKVHQFEYGNVCEYQQAAAVNARHNALNTVFYAPWQTTWAHESMTLHQQPLV